MASSKKNDVISIAAPHTIKKFELISKYVEAWAHILLESGKCNGIVYIDCMSNSGLYRRETADGEVIEGTALRVANIISNAMKKYTSQQAYIYFNDSESDKIDELKLHLPAETHNFHVYTEARDANELLNSISSQFKSVFPGMHFLLLYDPYDARIDWDALMPFLQNWGEVIINHMVSDSVRAAKMAKSQEAKDKYEKTYRTHIDELVAYGSDRAAYETRIQNIIKNLCGREEKYFVASFPFFNSNNSLVYNLIHCTGNKVGFDLFKSTAWQVFDDQSSDRRVKDEGYDQLTLNVITGEIEFDQAKDGLHYTVRDIATYVQKKYRGKSNVSCNEIKECLNSHPIFPLRGYYRKVCNELRRVYGAEIHRESISFTDRSC